MGAILVIKTMETRTSTLMASKIAVKNAQINNLSVFYTNNILNTHKRVKA